MIRWAQGDLLATPWLDAICHGCNTIGVMGAGLALPIRNRHPDMFRVYADLCRRGEFTLGSVFYWAESTPKIFNWATQKLPGKHASLSAVYRCAQETLRLCEETGIKTLGIPRIGTGLGGLQWEPVRFILIDVFAQAKTCQAWICEDYVAGKSLMVALESMSRLRKEP